MSAPQRQVLEVINAQCDKAEERFPGYRGELKNTLADILAIERTKPHNVVQQIEAKLEALGDLVTRKRPSIQGGEPNDPN